MENKGITTWESFASGAKQFLNDVVFQYVPKLIVACIVLIVGWKLINLLNKMMKRAYDRHKIDPSLQQFLHSLVDIILKVLLVVTAMSIMGIEMTSFIALLGAAGVAIGMGLQGTLQNFAGGVIILILKPFKVGDYIEQGSYAGYVESIQIFNTTLRTYDARKIIVPNTELATKSLVNHFNLPQRRVAIDVVAPMILAQTEAKDVVKFCFALGQLDVSHHMRLRLLVQEPIVAVTFYVFQLCDKQVAFYMLWLQPTMLETWKHHVVTILNFLDFHIVYCLVNRSVSFTHITLPPLPTTFL